MALNLNIDRVLRGVRRWRGPFDDEALAVDPDLRPADAKRLSAEIRAVIEGRGGPVGARRRARKVGLAYETLSAQGQRRFFELLASSHGHDDADVDRAMARVLDAPDPEHRREAERDLRRALQPGYGVLLRRLAGQDAGLPFLVQVREDLMDLDLSLPEFDAELRRVLVNWFDVGLLRLERLTWDTSAAFLEKLIEYEAVHAIESWDDLRARLGPGRRCYAFVHPGMPDDPLIFVEVALTTGLPAELEPLLAEADVGEDQADTATFYSISNCHRGLAGVSLGDFLIKSVVEELSAELPQLKTFATLSPIPGLADWLDREGREISGPVPVSDPVSDPGSGPAPNPGPTFGADQNRAGLLHLAARYLAATDEDGRTLDPVAHFHYTNGAGLERLNWLANPRPAGLEQSFGLMVNYRYDLRTIERNHDRYAERGRITMSDEVSRLIDRPPDGR